MKKNFSFIGLIGLLLIIGIVFLSCGGESPSSVVKKLHTAIEKEDAKAIAQLMTPEGAQMMAMMAEKAKGSLDEYGGIAKTEESITGDEATVKVTYKNGKTSDYDLVKIDGKWKVALDK